MNDDGPFWESDFWRDEIAPKLDLPDEDPAEAYPYLIGALEQARDGVLSELNGFAYSFVTQFGRLAVEWKEPMQVAPSQAGFLNWPLLENAWFRRGAELVLAEMALDRAASGFERLHELSAVSAPHGFGERATRYLREVSQLFLLGFDGPCIAFCGAALEQALKEALHGAKRLTDRDIANRRFKGGELLDMTRDAGLLETSLDNAKRLMHERNRAMHRHLWDSRVIRQMAAVSVSDLTAVLTELADATPAA